MPNAFCANQRENLRKSAGKEHRCLGFFWNTDDADDTDLKECSFEPPCRTPSAQIGGKISVNLREKNTDALDFFGTWMTRMTRI
jgi:hypothetical protein